MTRIRVRLSPNPSGYYISDPFGGSPAPHFNVNSDTAYQVRDFCEDTLGPKVDHALSISHRDNSGIVPLNGIRYRTADGGIHTKFENYIVQGSYLSMAHVSLPAVSSDASAATLALARTNPNRISVGVPQLLYELRDLPGMYRDIMAYKLQIKRKRANARDVANHYLAAQMGWLPLIGDICKLLDFQSEADKRVKELERLYSRGGLKRRFRMRGDESDGEQLIDSSAFIHSTVGTILTAKQIRYTTRKRWATVRWNPTSLPSSRYSSKQLNSLARRLVLGLSFGQAAIQAWNVIPWTWLAGWCVNMDDYIAAHNNTVPVSHSTVNIMTHWKTTDTWTRTDSQVSLYSGGEGTRSFEQKLRAVVAGPVLTATIPFLSGRQLSILGALALQRIR
jgi:hypothetical protein